MKYRGMLWLCALVPFVVAGCKFFENLTTQPEAVQEYTDQLAEGAIDAATGNIASAVLKIVGGVVGLVLIGLGAKKLAERKKAA